MRRLPPWQNPIYYGMFSLLVTARESWLKRKWGEGTGLDEGIQATRMADEGADALPSWGGGTACLRAHANVGDPGAGPSAGFHGAIRARCCWISAAHECLVLPVSSETGVCHLRWTARARGEPM